MQRLQLWPMTFDMMLQLRNHSCATCVDAVLKAVGEQTVRSIFETILPVVALFGATMAMPCAAAKLDASAQTWIMLDGIPSAPLVPGHDQTQASPIIDLAGLDLSDFATGSSSLPLIADAASPPANAGEIIPGLQLANFMGATDLEYSAPGVPMGRSVSGVLICGGIALAAALVRIGSHRTKGFLA